MSHAADPLERLRAANPVTSPPAVDWEHVRQHLNDGRGRPREPRVRLLAIAATSCAAVLALAVALLSSASAPSRVSSFTNLCDHAHSRCLGSVRVGVLSPPPNRSARPVAAQACAVIGPRCARGCLLQVAGSFRSLDGLIASGHEDLPTGRARRHTTTPGPGCTAKSTEQPCVEEVAGAGTRPTSGRALRALRLTERLLKHTPGGDSSPPQCLGLWRPLPRVRFPHHIRKGR
jgi:hypothetical protein